MCATRYCQTVQPASSAACCQDLPCPEQYLVVQLHSGGCGDKTPSFRLLVNRSHKGHNCKNDEHDHQEHYQTELRCSATLLDHIHYLQQQHRRARKLKACACTHSTKLHGCNLMARGCQPSKLRKARKAAAWNPAGRLHMSMLVLPAPLQMLCGAQRRCCVNPHTRTFFCVARSLLCVVSTSSSSSSNMLPCRNKTSTEMRMHQHDCCTSRWHEQLTIWCVARAWHMRASPRSRMATCHTDTNSSQTSGAQQALQGRSRAC